MSTAPARPASPANPPRKDGFFAWHGLWAPGVRLFRKIGFGSKAVIISLSMLVPLALLLSWQILQRDRDAMDARKNATRQHVEVAHGVLAWAHGEEMAGRLSTAQAQTLAMKLVSGLRYDREEYFWINDMHPKVVMHPIKPALDGKDAAGIKDPNGFPLFIHFVETVKANGEGFVPYQWPKPGKETPVDKISFVKGFAPWGWIIGSGIYVDDLREVTTRNLIWTTGQFIIGLSLAAYLFYCFYLVMNGGLRETRAHLRAMADGDLTRSPTPWGKDEAAELMNDLSGMQHALRQMVRRVRQSSIEIVQSSHEIAEGANDLSARTEQAVANLEQSAASMEEISATVRSTTDHTTEASRAAGQNAHVAMAGGEAMAEVIQTMDAIRASSNRISEIIGTIDGIAFQTNILALNAAVEAARAGDQGRGFAVVAGEVRSLAQRSAEAARQIKTLIGDSVGQVEASAGVVRKAGTAIEEIVSTSQRVSQLLTDIAQGSTEQSLGISQVGQAVQELDRLSQQNAGLVERTVGSAGKLKSQADTLADEVSRFKLPAGQA